MPQPFVQGYLLIPSRLVHEHVVGNASQSRVPILGKELFPQDSVAHLFEQRVLEDALLGRDQPGGRYITTRLIVSQVKVTTSGHGTPGSVSEKSATALAHIAATADALLSA